MVLAIALSMTYVTNTNYRNMTNHDDDDNGGGACLILAYVFHMACGFLSCPTSYSVA